MNFPKSAFFAVLILAGTFVLQPGSLRAQSLKSGDTALSFVTIGNYANFNAGDAPSEAKIGFGAGGLLELILGKSASFELGVLYLLDRGATLTGTELGQTYVQFPVLLRFHPGEYFSLGGGGYFALKLGEAKERGIGTSADYFENDYGLIVSAGITIPWSKSVSFLLDGRYVLGMADVRGPSFVSDDQAVKFSDIQVLFGLRFL